MPTYVDAAGRKTDRATVGSNSFVFGRSGVVNAGALSVTTPTGEFMNSVIGAGRAPIGRNECQSRAAPSAAPRIYK
ncbi:MAG: hypothetical protein Q8M24_16800 [Pseudolabrys sp.]|nr:hypothetical protein [Pseudolabrys sp.]MDP2297104.1 hypothetical protein [Pseudolabrys sp.]